MARNWTEGEVARLIEYRRQNLDWESIGAAMGRSAATCQQKYYNSGAHERATRNSTTGSGKLDFETIREMAINRQMKIDGEISGLEDQILNLRIEREQLDKIIQVTTD